MKRSAVVCPESNRKFSSGGQVKVLTHRKNTRQCIMKAEASRLAALEKRYAAQCEVRVRN